MNYKDGNESADLCFRPATEVDTETLFRVYASTRIEELAVTGWTEEQLGIFLNMQFRLQQAQYMHNYPGASFDVVLLGGKPAGRLYVQRTDRDMRIIDITLLPESRRRGIGGLILRGLIEEAEAKGLTMSLHVEMSNPIRTFYERLGFRAKDMKGIYYSMERRSNRPGS